ncbi:peptide chain release factor aRF-1 [Candidatus Bathyarchaeota archaeon]|nr:peptide chain release factor aRF-1 [Candidatus Bathyarchaeota archaeon]
MIYLAEKKSSLLRFRLERTLKILASKEGQHTELISLYIPPDKQISDVTNTLREEHGTASNIKSKTTRKNVMEAIVKVIQRLKLFKRPPLNGLVLFCGAIPQNGVGSEKLEIYVIEPPEPINLYYYRCDQNFHLKPLRDILTEKETYGIFLIDGNSTTIATLKGRTLNIVKEYNSGLSGKHRRGGQSQRRFERLRETQVNDYYKRVGNHANKIFLEIQGLKGIILGGPGPTKQDFESGEYLHYTLKKKILSIVDTAYTGEGGIEEVVEKSADILREVRYAEEKRLIQSFLYELGHDTGLVTYGEKEVLKALNKSNVRTVLISNSFDWKRVTLECSICNHLWRNTLKNKRMQRDDKIFEKRSCPQCSSLNPNVKEIQDIFEEIVELADHVNAEVEVISNETEEGVELESFGGIAAILRYKML